MNSNSRRPGNEALNFEVARLKRWRFGSSSESLDTSTQAVLFEHILVDTALEDRAAQEDRNTSATPPRAKGRAIRQTLPASLPRIEHHHELEQTHCSCGQALKRIGQEVSEQLDCVPAQFFVLRHIRGKYACACCQTIAAEPMPAQIIDKGIPAPGLLAQVAVAKHDDHLPLYRQSEIYARSGVHIARSSMAQWIGICGVRLTPLADALKRFILGHAVVHADETPVLLLAPKRGKTRRAYVWVYRTTNFVAQRAVLFDFCASRAGKHPQRMLQDFKGTLVTDDFSGYHQLLKQEGITGALCMAHARRKLFEAHKLNGSQIAGEAVKLIAKLYKIERDAHALEPQARWRLRQSDAKPIAEALHAWLLGQRQALAKSDVTAKAIDYSLSNWRALMRYLDDGNLPIDNNAVENAIRPLAVGRKNWLFVGSQQAGERAAVMLSLIESAKSNGHDPWAYLKDVFERLPTLKNSDLELLLPHTYSHLYGLPTTGLRFFTVYGPWGRPDMALFLFTKAILEDRAIDVFNHGKMQRDFTYVDDIVEGVIRVMDRTAAPNPAYDAIQADPATSNAPYRVFNIGNNNPVPLLDFIACIEDALGKKAEKRLLPLQDGDVPATYANTDALQEWVGFVPGTSIQDGIARFVAWYRDYYKT